MQGGRAGFIIAAVMLTAGSRAAGQGVVIQSLETPGRLGWTSPSLAVTCRVEWATSPQGPWRATWTNLNAVFVTSPSNRVDVPIYYRVVCVRPDPHFPDITAQQALEFIASRNDDRFAILDVRTPMEYAAGHIAGAINRDYRSASFASDLDALDKGKTYLIYCASGTRSGRAHDVMRGLGFREVYNMLGGFGVFAGLPGADPYLEQ